MFILRLVLAVALAIGAGLPALADPGEELAARQRLLAAEGHGLAIPSGCIATPYPLAAPALAAILPEVDNGCGAKVSLALWRQPRANNMYRSGGSSYLCAYFPPGTMKTYVLDQYASASNSDDQKAFDLYLRMQQLFSMPDYATNIRRFAVTVGASGSGSGRVASADRQLNCPSLSPKPTIDALRAKGVATAVASGKAGEDFKVSSPACISSAIAIGAATKADGVSSFSNAWSRPMLMAPGSGIPASVPGGVNQVAAESGWWWTRMASGRGYFIEARGKNIFLQSHHYLPSGQADWAIGQGRLGTDGLFQLDLRRFAGGTSFDGIPHAPTEIAGLGSVTVQFSDPRNDVIILPNGQRQTLVRFPI